MWKSFMTDSSLGIFEQVNVGGLKSQTISNTERPLNQELRLSPPKKLVLHKKRKNPLQLKCFRYSHGIKHKISSDRSCWVNLIKHRWFFSLSSLKYFHCVKLCYSTWKARFGSYPIWWFASLLYSNTVPMNTASNINHLSQVPTHRVRNHCQHANQGQGANGERQSRDPICRWRDRKAIRDLTFSWKSYINWPTCELFCEHFQGNSFYWRSDLRITTVSSIQTRLAPARSKKYSIHLGMLVRYISQSKPIKEMQKFIRYLDRGLDPRSPIK